MELRRVGLLGGFVGLLLASTTAIDVPLQLCDCHATIDQGVGCNRDGFFVAGYGSAGYPADMHSQMLPLSPAICCRPCVDNATAASSGGTEGEPVAVVTRSCSPANSAQPAQCGGDPSAFLQGFTAARPVPSLHASYPHDTAQCCEAALLLSTGLVRPLRRCRCGPPRSATGVSCGAGDTAAASEQDGRLLMGFARAVRFNAETTPTAPALCCAVCLDAAVPAERPEACSANGFCGGRGKCVAGRCVCSEGWRGGGCEQALRPRHAHWWFPLDVDLAALTPLEAAALGFVGVGLLTLSAALLCLLLLWRRALVMRAMAAAHPHHTAATAAAGTMMEEPLLGSSDLSTSSEEEGSEWSDEEAPSHAPADADVASPTMSECGVEAMQSAHPRPKPVLECAVCAERRVAIVCVPCGHACMCRACSRRLRHCPICHARVMRRQKLYGLSD